MLDILPELSLLDGLRSAILSASRSRPYPDWERGAAYATIDSRVLTWDVLERVLRAEARREADRLTALHETILEILRSVSEERPDRAAATALDAGEQLLRDGRTAAGAAVLDIALGLARHARRPDLEGQALRHRAKCAYRTGELDRASDLYRRARVFMRAAGDAEDEAQVIQGLANVETARGRWQKAEALYREALEIAGDHAMIRGQLFNNLSQVNRRQGRLEEARRWQASAEETWQGVDSPEDAVVALNNAGLLHLAEGDHARARAVLQSGLERATTDIERAAFLLNLTLVETETGDLERAESLAREAEEFSALAGAIHFLIEAYSLLGVVYRERGDDHCVSFFEKALGLDPDVRFALARARAHLEYGRYRRTVGDEEEARAHYERARTLAQDLHAVPELQEIDAALADL